MQPGDKSVDGQIATIRLKSGRTAQVSIARLRTIGQPSQIDEFVQGMRASLKT